MAGHSKWATTKHKKAAIDAKRGKMFAKLIKNIEVAARTGGGDPAGNPTLYDAIQKAKKSSVPNDNIDRAVKRGSGAESGGAAYDNITYEVYGPQGVAFMVECLTDNRNRTVAEVRHAFSKCGGNLGTDGSVAYLFTKKGVLTFVGADEDALMDAALEAGADDVVTEEDGTIEVYTTPNDFGTVLDGLEAAGFKPESAEVTMIPSTEAELDAETAPKLMRLIDMLEDLDDVQEVYHNGSISDEIAATL